MLDFIKEMFERRQDDGGGSDDVTFRQDQLAAAALMLEVAEADHVFAEEELATFKTVIASTFSLSKEEVEELYQIASHKQREATSIYQFTQSINEHSSQQEKFELIRAMWQLALADNQLDKYEEYIIRKVADLIYVSHTDFLVARNLAREEQQIS